MNLVSSQISIFKTNAEQHLNKRKQVGESFARASMRPQNDTLLFQNGGDANSLYLSGYFDAHFPNRPHNFLTHSQLLETGNHLLLLLRPLFLSLSNGGAPGLLPRFGGDSRGIPEVSRPEPLQE